MSELYAFSHKNLWLWFALSLVMIALGAGVVMPVAAQETFLVTCVNKTNGNMRLVFDPDECKQHEYALVWNVEGPPGEPGPQGEPGVATLMNALAASTDDCPYGGTELQIGLDNGDGGGGCRE